jgi:hypothetical protein
MLQTLKDVVRNEGTLALYRGISSPIIAEAPKVRREEMSVKTRRLCSWFTTTKERGSDLKGTESAPADGDQWTKKNGRCFEDQ